MYAIGEWIEAHVEQCRALVFLRSGLCVRKCNLLAPGAVWGLDVILGSEEHEDIEELLDTANARSVNFAFVLKLSKHSIDHAANLVPVFAKRLRKAHLRMLLWRGVIAASRATTRLSKPVETQVSKWDMLGKIMGQVVHRDRQILEGVQRPVFHRKSSVRRESSMRRKSEPAGAVPQRNSGSVSSADGCEHAELHKEKHLSRESDTGDGLDLKLVETAPRLPHLRRGADGGERAERGLAHHADDASCDALWKGRIQRSLAMQEERLTVVQEELSDKVATLQDGVEQLTRLMHQLLGRLDAEEKY
mmetsp:Transcript_115942/g.204951  ORF Transcript_115942/g.204951 Transcript_115942/m.204951 type:complete len:304 (+) Transcript_115942:2-913(+)